MRVNNKQRILFEETKPIAFDVSAEMEHAARECLKRHGIRTTMITEFESEFDALAVRVTEKLGVK